VFAAHEVETKGRVLNSKLMDDVDDLTSSSTSAREPFAYHASPRPLADIHSPHGLYSSLRSPHTQIIRSARTITRPNPTITINRTSVSYTTTYTYYSTLKRRDHGHIR
jgi:hypothetical protein